MCVAIIIKVKETINLRWSGRDLVGTTEKRGKGGNDRYEFFSKDIKIPGSEKTYFITCNYNNTQRISMCLTAQVPALPGDREPDDVCSSYGYVIGKVGHIQETRASERDSIFTVVNNKPILCSRGRQQPYLPRLHTG